MGMFPPKTMRLTELTQEQLKAELHPAQKVSINFGENLNRTRAEEYTKQQRSGTRIGKVLCLVAISTYFYTMYSLKQEKLGPEFDVRMGDAQDKNKNV